jgi:hypothetical protein
MTIPFFHLERLLDGTFHELEGEEAGVIPLRSWMKNSQKFTFLLMIIPLEQQICQGNQRAGYQEGKELYIMAGRSQERCREGFWCIEELLAVP